MEKFSHVALACHPRVENLPKAALLLDKQGSQHAPIGSATLLSTCASAERFKIFHKVANTPMAAPIVLASSSETRQRLLRAAGLPVTAQSARLDEDAIRASLEAEGASPRDIADTLAEMKARRIAERTPGAVVIGCDQVLDFRGRAWGKASTRDAAREQLLALRGQTHKLLSAVVVYHDGQPQWRHIGTASLTMRTFSDEWLESYLSRNWEDLRHSAGGYLLEAEGVRLFAAVDGDYFTILGLPLLPLLEYLGQRGFIPT